MKSPARTARVFFSAPRLWLALGGWMGLPLMVEAGSRVYFGTYDGPQSRGIYVSEWDGEKGELSEPKLAVKTRSPSFLALTPDRQYVVAVNEGGTEAHPKGAVTLYKIDAATGAAGKAE